MKLQDLIIDPRSLGSKLWLVDVAPVYEYKDNKRTEKSPAIATQFLCLKKLFKKSISRLTANSLWKNQTVMRK